IELVTDAAKLGLVVAFIYCALDLYALRPDAVSTTELMRRRVALLLAIALTASGIKVFEDVLGRESGPFDEAVLEFLHEHIPGSLAGFFAAVTLTGSFQFLVPVVALTTLGIALAKRRFDALMVALSPAIAALLVSLIKTAVGRGRPAH